MAILNIPGVGPREVPDNLSIEDKLRLMTQLQSEAGIQAKPQFGLGELFTRGVERGYERTKSTFGDVLPAMVASAFGADEYAKKQMEEARASQEELERRLPAMYKSYKDIGGVKDFLGYAVETLGEVAPDIATSLVPGGVGAVVGRGIATQAARQALTGAARQGLAREAAVGAAEKAAEKAASRGMLAGTYLGSYAQNAPEVFQSIYEETGSMNAPVAALYGGLSAALDSILPAKVLDQLGTAGKGALIRNLAEAQGAAPSVVKTIGKGVAKGMASEGLTESAQEFVNNLAVKTLKENYDLLSPENIDKYIDSFLRGAIAGGGVSLPTSAIEAARERSLARAQEQQKTAETAERQRVETEQLEQQQREQQKQQILQSIPQGIAPIEIGENIFTVEQTAAATDQVPPAYVVAGAQFSREVKTLDEAEKLKASIESTKEQDIADYEKKVQSTQEKLVKLDEELEKKQRDTINVSPEEFSKFQNETYPQQREKLLQQLGQEETILQRLDQPVTIKPKIRPDAPTVARGTDEFTLFKHTPEGKEVVEKTTSAEDAEAALDRVRQKEAPPTVEPTAEPAAQPPEELGGTEVTAGPELDELKQELDRLGLPEVGLKLMDGLTGGGSPVDGAFGQQTIYVAMTPTGRTRKQALHHEFIHALKEAGLFTPSEWKALSAAAKSDWMKRKWPNLGNRTIPETYGDLDLEGQIEEAIAVAFEHYTQKQYTPAMKVASAFQKIKNFLARVKNYFTGKGYQTAEDVFDFVESGAMRYKVRPEQMGGTGAKYARSIRTTAFGRVIMVNDVNYYNPKEDNFNNQVDLREVLHSSIPQPVIRQADEYVEQFYASKPEVRIAPEERARAEELLAPKIDLAKQAKATYDQMILNIVNKTDSIGQMLAPIKGIKRAAEKLVEEKFEVNNIKDLLRSTIVVTDYSQLQDVVNAINQNFNILRIKNRSENPIVGPNVQTEPRKKFGGYSDVMINIRMPNGIIAEIQINSPVMLAAKDEQGHKLYEAAREQPEGSELYRTIYEAMEGFYDAAFLALNALRSEAQTRKARSDIGAAPLSGTAMGERVSPESSSLKEEPSGKTAISSPENVAMNLVPSGKESGTRIIVPPSSKVKYALSFPQDVTDARRDLKLKRLRLTAAGKAYPGSPKNERMVLTAPGKPDFVTGDITIDDWKNRVQSLLSEQEIKSFANWYSEVNKLFKQYFPKNDPSVDNYMAAWLVANQNTDVSTAMKNALLQAEQIGRKMPESQMRLGGLETATIAARSAIRGVPITEGVGIKISDFVDSALGKNTRTYYGDHAVGAAPFVVDIHTARDTGLVDPILINHLKRLGYNVPEDIKIDFPMGPGETQYENRADFGREMTKRLNAEKWMGKSDWKPAEIQAIGWMAMTRLTADAVEDTRTALERNLQRISMEAAPGDGSPLAEKYGEAFSQLPADKQADLTQTLTTMAINAAQQISGIKLSSIVHGMGGWQHFQNPATVAQTLATPEGAEIASNVIGYLLQQTEVWSNKAKPLTKNPRGFAIDFLEAADGTTLATDAGILNFWNKVMEADPTKLFVGYQPIKTADNRHGIRVLVNKGGKQTSEKIFSAIKDNIKDMVVKSGLKLEVTGHEAEIIVARNDWTQDREGRAYLERLVNLGVADPAAKLDPLRSQFETVYKEGTGVRFARSPESQAGPSGSGHVVLGRTRKADAAEVKGVHYGNKLVDKLLGSMYGTGIRGAERQRLAKSTDERIKKRVYFYIEKPDGKMPPVESGLGAFVYTQNFGNVLAPGDKMSDMFAKANRDFNDFESSVVNAGYDGYAVPSMGMMVILNHDVPVNYEGTRDKVKFAKAAQEGIPPNVLKAQAMERLNEVQPMAEPNGYNLARSPVTAKAGMNVLNQFVDEAPTFGKQVVQRILDMPKNNRAMVYKFLTLEQLADVGQNLLPELKDYYETFQDMTGYREKQIYYAQKIAERLAKLKNKSPEMVERLADVCNDATLLGFDPDPAKKAVGTSLPIMKLKGDWNKLNQEAKDLYVEMRNFYENRFNAYQAMLQDRIDKSVTDPASRQAIMEKFRKMFESARNKGPYFPLSRFGQYWVSFEQGGIKNFRMFETLADSQRFQKELDSQGVPHNQGVRGDTMIPDGIPASQIQEIIGLVDTAGNPGELKQQIWNTYISMLPEVSMRKHFLPRKGTPGYSNDILRSFSENTFHGAYALARLKYAPDFDAAIAAMKKREKDLSGEQDSEKRSELLREVESRQQYIDNPTDTNFFTNMAGTIGFTWFLTAPASAITNLAQNVTVAFPILSAKFGTNSAMREMSTAYKQFMASAKRGEESVFDIQRTLQQLYNETKSAKYKREMDAINALMDNGTLSRTQTMDLAQLSDKPSMVGTRFHSTMKYVGMLFHGAEVMNRTTTALSAFRLSYEKHKSLGEAEAYQRALKDAREITRKAHFDYSASNKPPIMQGKTARVIFMFKQYGQHMAYMLLRETQLYGKYLIDKYRGTPMQKEAEIRAKEARDTVIGILCTTGMFSGVFGLPYPLYVLTITIANALFGDDDDEEFDAETRFKLWLTDTLGAGPADIIAKGPLSYLTGADISDRISSNGLIFRDTGRLGPRQAKDEDQVAATQQFLVEMAGPMGGLAMNIGQGIESFKNGQVYRGIEKMVPAPLRDAMETYRYNTEGVLTMKGDPILDEVSSMQSFVNLIGFAPVELARQYEENAAIKAVESKANMERKRILNKFALATNNHDFDALEDVEAAIERYNERFPSYEITGKTLAKSLKSREAASAENEHGVRVTKKLAGIAERAGQLTGTE